VGGEGVPQRVRAHPSFQPGGAGVALDDLVEALPRESGAAEVDEQVPLIADPHQAGTCVLNVGAERLDRLRPDRDDPLLGPLAARAQDPGLEIEL
jgi:hypothetical protein